jgi:hypothetical protein
MRTRSFVVVAALFAVLWPGATGLTGSNEAAGAQSSWRGLTVAPERRCSPYDADDYRYPQSVEDGIIRELGGVYGPYTGRWFRSKAETDIEHMVARSEAHDSGLCAADLATRRRFANDLLNLTLASPSVNRGQKIARDASEWMPEKNQCWFAARVVAVRQRYRLTIDRREADALERVLSGCESNEMVKYARGAVSGDPLTGARSTSSGSAGIGEWDDNGNGRISCAEARAHGIAPVRRGHPAYPYMRDGDGDGVVCE